MQKFLSRVFRYRVLVRKVMQLSASVISFVCGNEKKKTNNEFASHCRFKKFAVENETAIHDVIIKPRFWGGSFQLDRIVARENVLD